MNQRYHFISGLPRSGSTLLSSILKQNPKFTTGISDPLQGYMHSITQGATTAAGMEAVVPVEKRRELMLGLFKSFYQHDREVCFNTNRGWSADTALLKNLFPDFRMIVCLREIPWILDSFEQLNNKNPHTIKPLYHHQDLGNVYDRSHMLMGGMPNFAGYVAGPLANVKHSMFCAERSHLLYIEYDTLVKWPEASMRQIYQFLGEEPFNHDFGNVEDSWDEFDQGARIEGLHTVRRKVEWRERRSILPDELWNQYGPLSFWLNGFDSVKKQLNWVSPGGQFESKRVSTITPTPKPVVRPNRQL